MSQAIVLLLNGPGSAGKTSLAMALQRATREPFLHVQMDSFLTMQPPRHDNHRDTFFWETTDEDGVLTTRFHTGPMGAALMRGYRRSIAALAQEGWNVIADDVATVDDVADYRAVLSAFRLLTIKVQAPLAVLEAREKVRGDRMIGLARDQWQRIHAGVHYDFSLDTSQLAPAALAQLVCDRFEL
ncbi:MAG: hypothetical protein R3C00_00525 [Hyphomonas sp.]